MIVQMHTGAVLELFWRHRGVRSWSQATAFAFLSRYRRDPQAIRQLRQFLTQRATAFEIWQLTEEDVLRRAAMLINTGRLVVAQYRFTERCSGTGVIFGVGWDPALLLWRDELHLDSDVFHAVRWLRRIQHVIREIEKTKEDDSKDPRKLRDLEDEFRGHRRELDRLRETSVTNPFLAGLAHVTDDIFAEQTIKLLESGALIPIYHRTPGALDAQGEPEAPPPPPVQRPVPDREEAESNTFDPDHDAASQAAALRSAAEDGVPFCEECEKARRKGAA
jgi:hypothetical protein